MAQSGTRSFYIITEAIKDKLLADPNVNTVTYGDITEIDLSKQMIYPLSHLVVNSVSLSTPVCVFNISLYSMDLLDYSKEVTTDIFRGNNNEQDVLNTQLEVQNRLIEDLKRGTLNDNYQLVDVPTTEPFTDRFENQVAGWSITFDVTVRNDIDIDGA